MNQNYDVVETDVLVIGGGLAGMMAAIKAKSLGASASFVIKGKLPSGATGLFRGLGVHAYVDPSSLSEKTSQSGETMINLGS